MSNIELFKKAYPDPKQLVEVLYRDLSILDGKSSSLLTFNAIGLTALAVWLQYIPPNWLHFTLDAVFVMFLLSCILCLRTVWLFWSPPQHWQNLEGADVLLKKRDRRSLAYRGAWVISFLSVVVLLIVSGFHGFTTFEHASGACKPGCQHYNPEGSWGSFNLEWEKAEQK